MEAQLGELWVFRSCCYDDHVSKDAPQISRAETTCVHESSVLQNSVLSQATFGMSLFLSRSFCIFVLADVGLHSTHPPKVSWDQTKDLLLLKWMCKPMHHAATTEPHFK